MGRRNAAYWHRSGRQVSIEPKFDRRRSTRSHLSLTADLRFMIRQRIKSGRVWERVPRRRQFAFRPFFRGYAAA
jgi:hypothetical protein